VAKALATAVTTDGSLVKKLRATFSAPPPSLGFMLGVMRRETVLIPPN
jgi:hypothetical protein